MYKLDRYAVHMSYACKHVSQAYNVCIGLPSIMPFDARMFACIHRLS